MCGKILEVSKIRLFVLYSQREENVLYKIVKRDEFFNNNLFNIWEFKKKSITWTTICENTLRVKKCILK